MGKGKAATSQNPVSPSAVAHAYGNLVRVAMQRMLLDTHNSLRECQDPRQALYLKKMIDDLQRQLEVD